MHLTNNSGWWDSATKIHGKEMSYLNLFDTEAAWRLVHAMGNDPTVTVIKHANPCGVATHDDITEAYIRANACDPVSAFGGIVAVNREVPLSLAEELSKVFTEVIIAPSFEEKAIEKLSEKKNIRIIEANPPGSLLLDMRSIDGGLLVQTSDRVQIDQNQWEVVTDRQPTPEEWSDLEFAWRVAAKVSSNCISYRS